MDTTWIIGGASFVSGFLLNLATMRSWFISTKACDSCKESSATNLNQRLETLETRVSTLDNRVLKVYGVVCALAVVAKINVPEDKL